MPATVFSQLDTLLRVLALAALAAAGAVALTHSALRARRLSPFGPWARWVRRWSDPLLLPIERRILRFGRTPQEAPLWLVGLVVVSGILLITVTRWLGRFLATLAALATAGPAAMVAFAVNLAFDLLILALLVRIIGSWLGAGRFTRVVLWAYRLTDWLVEPIRRRLPPFGAFDWSPLVAYLILFVARALLLGALR